MVKLGQNFLVDRNILDVIERLAALSPDDVVLEIGGGEGVLSERLAASPGTPAYGAPSVLAQLACDVKVLRPISRTVFRPAPNVDSVLVGLTRHSAPVGDEVRKLVHDAFAHRRKTLPGSLALAPGAQRDVRELARRTLTEIGHPPDERAERLSPDEFRQLAARL